MEMVAAEINEFRTNPTESYFMNRICESYFVNESYLVNRLRETMEEMNIMSWNDDKM